MRKFETKKEVKEFLKEFYLRSEEKIVFVSRKQNGTFEALTVIDCQDGDSLFFRYGYDTNDIVDCYELDDSYNYNNAVDSKTKKYMRYAR